MGGRIRGLALLGVAFGMIAGGNAFAEDLATSYRASVGLDATHRLFIETDVDLVTNEGEFRQIVISDSAAGFYFSAVRGRESDSARVTFARNSTVYDAIVEEEQQGTDPRYTVRLFDGTRAAGRVTIVLGEILPPRVVPFGGGTPGVDIAVSRVGMNSGNEGDDYFYYGAQGGIRAFSAGTTSCNVGSTVAEWIAGGSARHPLIAQNVYRYADGRFEQIGQSWLKHSFCAVSEPTCGSCQPTSCGTLGIGCADTYWATLNGDTDSGPRSQVNPQGILPGTGTHTHPYANPSGPTPLRGRIQIADSDINVPGARFFIEAQYITHDEPLDKRHNNATTREINLTSTNMSSVSEDAHSIEMFKPALRKWTEIDPSATVLAADVPGEGRFHIGYSTTDNGDGTWHYEYAIHNMNSDRSGGGFSVPVGAGNVLTNVGFRDIDYHSGEVLDNTDWNSEVTGSSVSWSSPQTFAANPNSNALRWGTTYNFRFDAPGEPILSEATLSLFKPGSPESIPIEVPAPAATVQTPFVRGDIDGEGSFNALVDALYLLEFGFLHGPPPLCDSSADADDNGEMHTLVDTLYLLTYNFLGGAAPPAPFPDCGPDPTSDAIPCESNPGCP